MQDFSYVLSECEEINSLLYKPISSTQRIKYTCLNVSTNYVVLGSTSGSIYLFTREPCTFQQLIPLSEGVVSQVVISPDERAIALATTRGSVCLVALKPSVKLIAVSTEHVSEQVTCLCWNENSSEVYIGDGIGKVSVMVLSIFSVNGMFQAPACTLMNLDSSVVQLNYSSPLLLVSTLTRCYICDTVQEQYKQIGNKGRNGQFGACFFKARVTEKGKNAAPRKEERTSIKGSFSFISECDSNVSEENTLTIFCARPGSRLWEVSANGIVMKTHQFKDALSVPATELFVCNKKGSTDERQIDRASQPRSINFSHLCVIEEKYLFAYTSSGLYVLDPVSASVVLWCDNLSDISTLDVIENKIYLMTRDNEFHCLTLCSIDTLLLRLYNNRQYYDCLDACARYKSQLLKSITGKEIREIWELDSKSRTLQDDEISAVLRPLISLLRSNLNTLPIKLDSGIVVVNTGSCPYVEEERQASVRKMYSMQLSGAQSPDVEYAECTVGVPDGTLKTDMPELAVTNKNYQANDTVSSLDAKADAERRVYDNTESDRCEDATQKVQSDLEPVYMLINSIKSSLAKDELEEIIVDIERRIGNVRYSYETLTDLKGFMYEVIRTAELYYCNAFLENAPVELSCSSGSDRVTKQFVKAFTDVNRNGCSRCTCSFPYPARSLTEPMFLTVGKALLRNFTNGNKEESMDLCDRVPYMWREYLPFYISQRYSLDDVLRQCLQLADSVTLSLLLPALDARQWRSTICYLKTMQDGECLSCGRTIGNVTVDRQSPIDWAGVAREITRTSGPDEAVAFLTKLETVVPDLSFDRRIFQSLVFTKILHHHGTKYAVAFNEANPDTSEYNTMCSAKIRDQLVKVLEKDLGRPVHKNAFGTGAHHWGMRYKSKSSTCPCCTLSLQTPVLLGNNGITIFPCGHAYHVSCMMEKKLTRCNLHT